MKALSNKELKEIIQSGHLNLLIGSGCSLDYISTLKDIEDRMNDEKTREKAQKDYFKLIKKSKAILDESLETNADEKNKLGVTRKNYDRFLNFWSDTISRRSLHIVNKQVNIFTTNFDMFMEDSCERLGIPYNDGFTGQIKPTFNASNFNKIQKYKSLQFDNTSDIPLFNIFKLHGSVSWCTNQNKIVYSDGSHIPDDLAKKSGKSFSTEYEKIAVINPNAEKHFETVLDTNYASLLRKFTLELEKENSVLFVIGFSLADKHIKDLLYGVMRSNPTLVVVYFSHSKYDETVDSLNESKNSNLYVISPEADLSFDKITSYLTGVFTSDESIVNDEDDEQV
ncbi:MAG TPA: SIR2 family protein [Candidatus Dormibacteraeota bacterium]|nr:SIR2 family protein [Candidatus Dormibacteraeota bacterium]